MGDLLRQVTPLLGKRGLVIWQTETGRAMFDGDNVQAIAYAFTVAHGSGETSEPKTHRNEPLPRFKGRIRLNKCATAARKYFLLSLPQIPTGDEEDADRGDLDRPSSREQLDQTDGEISGRRAAVKLSRSPPAAIRGRAAQAPAHRFIQAQRDTGTRYEAQIKAEQRGEQIPPGDRAAA